MERLHLPWVLGPREKLVQLIEEQGLSASLAGERLILLCRNLATASESVMDELVRQVLVDRDAAELAIVAAPRDFVAGVREAAARYGMADRVAERRAVEVGV